MLRTAKKYELERVMKIIEDGKEFLKEQGVNQWQHGSPSRDEIINDINERISYVYEKSGEIVATAKLFRNQGITREFMEAIHLFSKSQNIKFLRIDTHFDNKIMKKFLSNLGFEKRGIIKLSIKNILDDKERIAYDLKIE